MSDFRKVVEPRPSARAENDMPLSPEEGRTSVISALVSRQLQALVDRIAAANVPGNLDGLFAFYVIGDEPAFPLAWNVSCATEEWLERNAAHLNEYPVLATIGYSLRHTPISAAPVLQRAFIEGMTRLRRRDPLPEDRISFAYQPKAFLGLALGVVALGELGAEYRAWLQKVLSDRQRNESTPYHMLLYSCIRYELTGETTPIGDVQRYTAPHELALLVWGIRRGILRLLDTHLDASMLQTQILHAALTADLNTLDPSQASLIWQAIHTSLMSSIGELVLSRSHVSTMLRRFEAALRRWRWDNERTVKHPIRWPITNEREVQDILWLMLRSVFDDVVDEDTLPRLGHSTYRADFGIPSLRLLVEVKYARQASDF
jgi:hypothetical protein